MYIQITHIATDLSIHLFSSYLLNFFYIHLNNYRNMYECVFYMYDVHAHNMYMSMGL